MPQPTITGTCTGVTQLSGGTVPVYRYDFKAQTGGTGSYYYFSIITPAADVAAVDDVFSQLCPTA